MGNQSRFFGTKTKKKNQKKKFLLPLTLARLTHFFLMEFQCQGACACVCLSLLPSLCSPSLSLFALDLRSPSLASPSLLPLSLLLPPPAPSPFTAPSPRLSRLAPLLCPGLGAPAPWRLATRSAGARRSSDTLQQPWRRLGGGSSSAAVALAPGNSGLMVSSTTGSLRSAAHHPGTSLPPWPETDLIPGLVSTLKPTKPIKPPRPLLP